MALNYRTQAAAERLTELGQPTSRDFLKKVRTRGAEDHRDKGPDYWRDASGICWYSEEALARYAALKLSGRQFRSSAPEPERLRRGRDAT